MPRLCGAMCQDVSAAVKLLEHRLEEVEAAAAQREAEELLGAANALLSLAAVALALLGLVAGCWRTLLAHALLALLSRLLFFRQLRALWLCVLGWRP